LKQIEIEGSLKLRFRLSPSTFFLLKYRLELAGFNERNLENQNLHIFDLTLQKGWGDYLSLEWKEEWSFFT
jgi:hypothetical protein